MKYLYGDSTESQLQKDFLGLLENFIDTSVRAVTFENNVLKLKEDIREKRRLKNFVLEDMDNLLLAVEDAITDAASKSREQETIWRFAEKSKDFQKKFISESKDLFSSDISREIKQIEEQVRKSNERCTETLGSFFIRNSLPVIDKKYTIKAEKEGYFIKILVYYDKNISGKFSLSSSELPFWQRPVKAYDLLKGLKIPVRMRKPFLKSDPVPDIAVLDYYYLTDLTLYGKKLEVVFRRKPDLESERFRFKMDFTDEFAVEVYYAEEKGVEKDIQAVIELKEELNLYRLKELGGAIMEKMDALFLKKQRLESVYIEGKDVVSENNVFELMTRVAEIFAPVVNEIKKHTPSEEELSLKEQDDTGRRREIYLKKSQVKNNLEQIGEKGESLFRILDIK